MTEPIPANAVRIFVLHYRKSDLVAAPELERAFFLLITQLTNDVQILWKQVMYSLNLGGTGVVEKQAASTVGMLNLRLLAGRLSEGGSTLHKVYRHIRDEYDAELESDAREAVAELFAFFGDRNNLLTRVRNDVGFHADAQQALQALADLNDDAALGDYLSPKINNTLYWSAAVINDAILRRITGQPQAEALDALMKSAQWATSGFNRVAFAFTRVFAQRYFADGIDALPGNIETVDDVADVSSIRLPFFCRMDIRSGQAGGFGAGSDA